MAGDNGTAVDPAVSSQTTSSPDIAFMLTCTALVQLMTPGLAFFYAGLCRPSGTCAMMAKSIVSLGVVTLLWFVFGFGMAFGPAWDPWNLVGSPFSYTCFNGLSEFQPLLMPGSSTPYGSPDLPGWLYAMYQNKFAVITPALASGAIADRMTLGPWAFFIAFWIILIYMPWCHAIWGGGYYAQQGVVDFAGGIVVHTTSGWSALVLAWTLGHREDKEERPHSVPLVVLGTALLWFGWFGFNAGSAYAADGIAVAAATNSMVAAASAMIGWKMLDRFVTRGKIGLIPMCVGAIAGLATITPAAGFVQPGAALVFGFLASLVCFAAIRVANGLGVDDALDVWAVHGVGGALGSILVAIFADPEECKSLETAPDYCVNPGTVAAGMAQLKKQTEATVLCAIYSMVVSYVLIKVISFFVKVTPSTSVVDQELGETAYDMAQEGMAAPLLDSRAPEPTGGRWEAKPDGSKTWKPGLPSIVDSGPPPPPKATTLQVATKASPTMSSEIMPIGSGDDRLAGLPQFGKIMAEYVWLGGAETTGGFDIRSKSRTLTKAPRGVSDLPIWNFDGSSTGQAPGNDSEVLLKPVAIYPDPFRGGMNIIVLCECLDPKLNPIPTNTRHAAAHAFARAYATEPWFGIEQEYTLFEKDGVTPLGWPVGGEPKEQGPYYCSAGYDVSFGRNVMECHYRVCLYAGLNISGTNAEVMPGQWEYQIGPCTGIESGDQMWMSRYFMIRVCELLGVNVSFDPKPIPGDWNGAGCHTNYSTVATRKAGGFKEIIKMVEKLGPKHFEHIEIYGEGNERRLTGKCETAAITDFSYGVANRGASIRIPRSAEQEGCGYFEDRRPASNCDPYLVTAKIFQTTVLDGEAGPQKNSQIATLVSPSQMGGQWSSKPDGSRVWSVLGAAAEQFRIGTRAPVAITTATGEVMPIGSGDARLKGLPQFGKIMAEYVWLGGAETTGGFDIRSKSRTLDKFPATLNDFPIWNFDGSSTGQAPGNDSEVLLKPVAIYPDPFRGGLNIIVLCECLDPKMKPIPSNTRNAAAATFAKATAAVPWFGIEQEYTLFEKDGVTPLGWPVGGEPKEQGPYYCSAGYDVSFGRNVMECHYRCCLYAGLDISGTNAEVMPGQWEYQIGPCTGIASGDQMWISRYFMIRVCELLEVNVSFDPKPIPGDWNGAGCHTNFSTVATRQAGGFKEIIKMVEKLGPKHFEHIEIYGEGNERRLTGKCETAAITDFSYGVANRGASIRIPRSAEQEGCGYFEDRRPASNCDPYLVTAKIFQTTVLE